MFRKIILTSLFLMFAAVVYGEYYQYTDGKGIQRYTDDFQQVPESQRTDVKIHESVKTDPDEVPAGDREEMDDDVAESDDAGDDVAAEDAAGEEPARGVSRSTANELDKIQMELRQKRESLEKERDALQQEAPPDGAKTKEKIAYGERVEALNDKIKEYEEDVKAFDEKVNAFNTQVGKK